MDFASMKLIGINELLMLVSGPRVAKQPKGYLTVEELAAKWCMSPVRTGHVLRELNRSGKIERLKFGRFYVYGPFKDA